ncbi:MAG: hypothetical protein D3925_03330 [Candidatus Electrothrix sp. AR5]|nr:hypothetical protein [Candidatus Electrothrix sp. AR5]
MFDSIKKEIMIKAVLSERIRTIFYLSRHLQKTISVLLVKPHLSIEHAIVVNGVITYNGTSQKESGYHHIGGQFSIGIEDDEGCEICFDFSDIRAISIGNVKDPKELYNRKDTVKVSLHLTPCVGTKFGLSGSNEAKYYYFLALLTATSPEEIRFRPISISDF